jgi:signal transduction histidine kinase
MDALNRQLSSVRIALSGADALDAVCRTAQEWGTAALLARLPLLRWSTACGELARWLGGLVEGAELVFELAADTAETPAALRCRAIWPGGHDPASSWEPVSRLAEPPALLWQPGTEPAFVQQTSLGPDALAQALAQAPRQSLAECRELVERLTHELEDTNRGVVALYAELDEHAEKLRLADDMKSRFLSNMSHEFKTPLSSMRALCRLLLSEADGALGVEQSHQIDLIRKAADDMSEMVADLLDIAKIEAGKLELRLGEVVVDDLFSGLRGMFKPLLVAGGAELVFEPADGLVLVTDDGKLSQILRNLVSNALKFTPRGEVRVSCRPCLGHEVEFAVRDTGIGIAVADQQLVFEEFVQVANELQGRTKGTGLGLPLCRRLAEVLGGRLRLESEPAVGSTFSLRLPRQLAHAETMAAAPSE